MSHAGNKSPIIEDLSQIKITNYALSRFRERYEKEFRRKLLFPDREIRRLLKKAQEMERRMGAISRVIYSHTSKYWQAGGWYFITDKSAKTLITAYRRTRGAPRWRPKRKFNS